MKLNTVRENTLCHLGDDWTIASTDIYDRFLSAQAELSSRNSVSDCLGSNKHDMVFRGEIGDRYALVVPRISSSPVLQPTAERFTMPRLGFSKNL